MPTIQFSADIFRASELCQTNDYSGVIIAEDKRTKYCVEITAECKSSERDIEAGTTIFAEMPMTKVAGIPKDQRANTAGYHAAIGAKERLERVGTWELYGSERITLYGSEVLEIPSVFEVEADIQIIEPLAEHFRKATKLQQEVEQALKRAKDYLESGLNYACNDGARLSRAARYIADCMNADGTPIMDGWNREKSAVLLDFVADLIKRRNPNHPNYQSKVSWIHSTLYSVDCPFYWSSYPPQPHLLDLR